MSPSVLVDVPAVLRRTPAVLDTLLRDLPDAWLRVNEGDSTWSAMDVVAHLIHTEQTNWLPRLRILFEHGTAQPFGDFDRFGHLKTPLPASVHPLLDTFAAVRADSLSQLEALRLAEPDLDREGTHPMLGTVTARQLLSAWMTHDLDHVMQVTRVLAHSYKETVGPWRDYLRILG